MAFEHTDGSAARGEFRGDREAGDTGPDDRDVEIGSYGTTLNCITRTLLNVPVTELWANTANM